MTRFTAKDPDFEKTIRASFARQGIMGHLGAEIDAVRPGYCAIRLPFIDALSQQHGFFHGGVVSTIADTAGGYAAFSLMAPGDGVLTVEFKINLTAPADGESLIARGQVVRPGRTLTVSRVEVAVRKDGRETTCAVMQQTLMRIVGRAEVSG